MNVLQNDAEWASGVIEKIIEKMKPVTLRTGNKIPYTTVNGVFDDRSGDEDIPWWTNGFWGGIMWQLFSVTGNYLYQNTAIELEEKLDRVLMNCNGLDHDNGFKWLPTAVAHYSLDQNPQSYNRAILAAENLAGRFNLAGNFIRAWNDWGDEDHRGWAIIDCMMNLPLLYWASARTGDPRFQQIAEAHAKQAQKYFIREDGSVNHIVEFNPFTGEMIKSHGGQGYGTGSSWTRGQSWGLYGFTLSYIHTGNNNYLNAASKIADYFISNIPENGLIPVDFRQPVACTWEDSSAAAIAASGLIELSRHTKEQDSEKYLNAALLLLKALDQNRCNWKKEEDYILEKCTAAYHDKEHEFSIIYGDYYFIEAVFKLADKGIFIW